VSRENVERVKRSFELVNRRELEAWAAMLAPDVEWHVEPQDPDATVHRGREAARRYVLSWIETMGISFQVREILDAGEDQVVALTRLEARGGASGVPVEMDLAFVLTLRDGFTVRVQEMQDNAKALEAVGLPEQAMSPEMSDALRQLIQALNRRDVERMVSFMSPDVEWRPALTAGGNLEGVVYSGHEGVAAYVSDLNTEFSETEMEIEDLREIDATRVLYRGRARARGRASGIALDVPIWAIWEFREGKLQRGTAFMTEAEALEAAGLRE
jgi:ketosteroid isomerase-like protein